MFIFCKVKKIDNRIYRKWSRLIQTVYHVRYVLKLTTDTFSLSGNLFICIIKYISITLIKSWPGLYLLYTNNIYIGFYVHVNMGYKWHSVAILLYLRLNKIIKYISIKAFIESELFYFKQYINNISICC